MTWIALLAALQEPPSRWDFKAGSWVEMNVFSLTVPHPKPRAYREDVGPTPPAHFAGFTDGLKEVSRRADTWQKRACTVIEYKGEERIVKAWVVDGLRLPAREMPALPRWVAVPGDVVRAFRVEKRGTSIQTSQLEVLELHAPVPFGEKVFDCVLERSYGITETPTSAVLRSRRRWLSAEVPGHIVRQDRQCTANPAAAPYEYTSRDELKDFHVER